MVKQLRLMIALFAMILFAVSLASAISVPSSISFTSTSGYSNSTTFAITNNESVNFTGVSVSSLNPSLFTVSIAQSVLNASSSANIIVTAKNNLGIATFTGNIALSYNNTTDLLTVNIPVTINVIAISSPDMIDNINATKLCQSYSTGNTNISISSLDDRSSGTDGDWSWKALDSIRVRVSLYNERDKDNSDYKVQLYFFNSEGSDVSSKFVSDTALLKQDVNNLDNGDSKDVDFSFKLSTDVKQDSYTIVAKAVKRSGNLSDCALTLGSDSQTVDVSQNDYYAVVSNVISSKTVSCGDSLDITATVANTGSEDEERVKVFLYSYDFKFNVFQEIDNLNSGDSKDVTFSVPIPSNAAEKLYGLTLSTQFNYDSNDDSYSDQSDSKDNYIYSFNVLGNCNDPTKPTITAKLNSTAIVGDNLVVEIDLKNNLNQSLSAIITPEGYDAWAELVGVDPSTITVLKQATGKAYMTLKPTEAGQQTLNLNIVYNGRVIDQQVSVKISEKTSMLSGLYNQFGTTGTYLLIGIVALIILIAIVIAVKAIVSRKA